MKITQASIQTLAILGAATATNAASLRGSKAESVRHHSQSGVGRKNHTTSERKGAGVLKPNCSQCHTDSKNLIGGDCLYLNRMMLGKDSLFFGNALENASKYIKVRI